MPWYSGINTVPVHGVSNVQRRIRSKEEFVEDDACIEGCVTVGIQLHAGSDAAH